MQNERRYWNKVFARPDPWNYTSEYEQLKYRHTLALLPATPIRQAVETGCAEGLFTRMLATHVDRVLAVDISDTALTRARTHCAELNNVTFARHNISEGIPGEGHDLIVCSEVLYYLRDRAALERFAQLACGALRQGGYLLLTHPNMVSDDKSSTGFDFAEFGAGFIDEVFSAHRGFRLVRELRTDLYRVQLFQRVVPHDKRPLDEPPEVVIEKSATLDHPDIRWGGCLVTSAEARFHSVTPDPPILMYHRIADSGAAELSPYRTSPQNFEWQLSWLRSNGFRGMRMEEYWHFKIQKGSAHFEGKPIVLTFDDAYADFYTVAWPLLRRYGFNASVFVPTDHVGGAADWDSKYGPPARLMNWQQIRELAGEGVEFGSHSRRHVPITELSIAGLFREVRESRSILSKALGKPVKGFCYPFSMSNRLARAAVAFAGYSYAVGGERTAGPSRIEPYNIRRIEILGSDRPEEFISRIPEPLCAEPRVQARYRELRSRRDRRTYFDL